MTTLKKAELIACVADKACLAKVDAEAAIEALLETIVDAMKEEKTINFSGFGSFSTIFRPARTARNPRTGENIEVAETKIVKFKIAKSFKEAVADSK
ncbi:MAG: HU family DNA-binding protein [Campylobacterales bacterium]|nr:HU family DNA-binding protein [Campylobacterales bacterium]